MASASSKSLIARWRGLRGRWRFAIMVAAWVLLCSLPLGYCERRYLGHPITRWFDEQQASVDDVHLSSWFPGPEVCGLEHKRVEPWKDPVWQDWSVSFWADPGSLKTDRPNSSARNMVWVAATSIKENRACTARYAFTLTIKEDMIDYYRHFPHSPIRSFEVERIALLYRLAPPPARQGYRSILPGQCVITPIDQNEKQEDRFLIDLPADKRINVTLMPHYMLENYDLLSWSISPDLRQKVVRAWPPRGRDDFDKLPTQHGITTASGIHEIVVSRSVRPEASKEVEGFGQTEPLYIYTLMITWGEESTSCFGYFNAVRLQPDP